MALAPPRAAYGRGPVAAIDPTCRLACLALLSSSALLASWILSACLAVAFFVLLVLSGLGIARILRETLFVAAFALATAALRAIGAIGATPDWAQASADAGIFGLRLLAAYWAGRLFYASTRPSEIRDASTRICRRLPILRRYDVGLAISLTLNYIPLRPRDRAGPSHGLVLPPASDAEGGQSSRGIERPRLARLAGARSHEMARKGQSMSGRLPGGDSVLRTSPCMIFYTDSL
jgi:hypothetical protein